MWPNSVAATSKWLEDLSARNVGYNTCVHARQMWQDTNISCHSHGRKKDPCLWLAAIHVTT